MATEPTPHLPTIEPDQLYDVKVNRVVSHLGTKLRPAQSVQLKGAVVLALGDAIASATLVAS